MTREEHLNAVTEAAQALATAVNAALQEGVGVHVSFERIPEMCREILIPAVRIRSEIEDIDSRVETEHAESSARAGQAL